MTGWTDNFVLITIFIVADRDDSYVPVGPKNVGRKLRTKA